MEKIGQLYSKSLGHVFMLINDISTYHNLQCLLVCYSSETPGIRWNLRRITSLA